MEASKMQVDGTHYTDMPMQPIELTYLIGGTPCFCKLAKYGSRIKHSDRTIDLNKAIHCIRLEQEFVSKNENIFLKNYKKPGYVSCETELATTFINIFTQDQDLRDALLFMYIGEYEMAIVRVQNIISRVSV
ncbi:hypothetical protein [Klebsiella phage 05F01]|nr:hypothetical protein [Klebsiella phage 05F01]